MKATIEIFDEEDGSVTMTAGCDPLPPGAAPTGAMILWAYITQNCETHMVDSGLWLAEKVKEARDE
jgi:hypothetical protein